MSQLSIAPQSEIESWTKEDVHHWLMTEVKVHQSCADTFIEEEVSGGFLHDMEKKDILELGIKHGPAVKITFYLERLKEGSQPESQFPADVENWTTEQVIQWLQQRAKIDSKKAERFQEEDVSGDCLVCFKKQDFLDLDLKKGPTVKIMKELDRLKNKESMLHPVLHNFRRSFRIRIKRDNSKTHLPPEKTLEKDPPASSQEKKETAGNPAPVIKNTLDKLGAIDLKSFHFQLQHYTDSEYKPIPRSRLEHKDTIDIATVVTDYYGCEKALHVTRDILLKINQRQLVFQLESHMGLVKHGHKCHDDKDSEDTVKSCSSSCSRCKHQKTEEKNPSCFMFKVNVNVPTCFN